MNKQASPRSIRLKPELLSQIKILAEAEDRSVNYLINKSIESYLNHDKSQAIRMVEKDDRPLSSPENQPQPAAVPAVPVEQSPRVSVKLSPEEARKNFLASPIQQPCYAVRELDDLLR